MGAETEQSSSLAIALAVFWGTIASLIATFVAERLKRPSIRFEIDKPVDDDYSVGPTRPAKLARFVRVKVMNKPLPWLLSWLGRNALISCQARIDFFSPAGAAVFASSMIGRWAETPQPVPMQIQLGGVSGMIIDHFRFHQTVDIPAGETRTLDVAAHFDQDTDSYGWSNESYAFQPNWRNQQRRLPRGDYVIRISMFHLGGRKEFECLLSNQASGLLLHEKEIGLIGSANQKTSGLYS